MLKNNEARFVIIADDRNDEDVKVKVRIMMNDNIWHEVVLRETHNTNIVMNETNEVVSRVYSGVGAFE